MGIHSASEGVRCTWEDMAQWLECEALALSLPAVRFRIPLGVGFSEQYSVSPLTILGHCFDAVPLGKALNPQMLHLTGRKEMAMCMICSIRRNGCRTVCSQWS